jgi:hypothetical protein
MLLLAQFRMPEEIATEGGNGSIQTCECPQETRT